MDSIQASLESEQRAKAEALRIKKKLEGEINELEIGVDQANKANSEASKLIKRFQGQFRDAEVACSEEAKARAELQGKSNIVVHVVNIKIKSLKLDKMRKFQYSLVLEKQNNYQY